MHIRNLAKVISVLVLFTMSLSNPLGMCGELDGPEPGQKSTQDPEINIGARLVSIFRDHISEVDGDRCISVPSCSSYSIMAFEKHGFFLGWLLAVDRLIHEIDESSVSPVVHHNDKTLVLDPLENNDFWWFDPDEKSQH
ncbi:MAG: membrane protein insertion efficiency factor YidD [Desulfobacterales bacterium]|nr:membrane protein insertion efficiency factor YidD [Desulfobacterales bacterium]